MNFPLRWFFYPLFGLLLSFWPLLGSSPLLNKAILRIQNMVPRDYWIHVSTKLAPSPPSGRGSWHYNYTALSFSPLDLLCVFQTNIKDFSSVYFLELLHVYHQCAFRATALSFLNRSIGSQKHKQYSSQAKISTEAKKKHFQKIFQMVKQNKTKLL